jgi:hypothetical protein
MLDNLVVDDLDLILFLVIDISFSLLLFNCIIVIRIEFIICLLFVGLLTLL